MQRVPEVLEEHRAAFASVFGRDVAGAVETYRTEDADTVFVTSGSIATTMRDVVDKRRGRGEKVGMLRIKMFRPFPVDAVRAVCAGAKKVGVLDRNCTADRGGIFWQEICAAMQGQGHPLIQGYLTGVGGSDVIPKTVHEVADDLAERTEAGEPVWKGL
jgi:pyruvate ferredoxin oxidoreductase alpha subunit